MTTGALAHLRRKPGRPRKAASGHTSGIPCEKRRVSSGPEEGALANSAIAPRLLDVDQAASYLGVSPWTIRDMDAAGTLRRVCVPLGSGRELRRVLYDRADLDQLIERCKESGPCP